MKMRLLVSGLSSDDGRSDLVRIHRNDRDHTKFPRWTVVKLSCRGRSRFVVVLGRDGNPGKIELDFDHRQAFDLEKGVTEEFELTKANALGQLRYLLQAKDPMLRLPTWIALVSLVIGLLPTLIEKLF